MVQNNLPLKIAPKSPSSAGIFFALGGGVTLSINDLAIKALSGTYALHQIILIRAFVGLSIVLALMAASKGGFAQLRTNRWRSHLLRVCIVMVSNVTYFLGLAAMPLADAVATAFISPLLITMMSALFLGEYVGPRRWAAVVVGMIGVLLIVRPGSGVMQPAAILVLISAFCYAGSNLMTRRMGDTESAATLSFYIQIGFIVVSVAMGAWVGDGHLAQSDGVLAFLFRPWIFPHVSDYFAFFATGAAVGVGGLMMSQAYRTAEAALVAPFEYIGMPMAIFWGVLVFGTWPDHLAWVGMTLICGAGLYTLWRETVHKKVVNVAAPSGDI